MPILPVEPEQFPHNLFDPEWACPADRSWWVLHTRPRQEKSLARQLHAAQVPFYLPLTPRGVRVRNRMVTSYIPLFTSYVFLLASQEERVAVLATGRVVNSIQVTNQEQLVSDLVQVSRLIHTGAALTAEDQMIPGATVEIQSGPLAGLKGKIVQQASRCRFIVEVNFIQRDVSVL